VREALLSLRRLDPGSPIGHIVKSLARTAPFSGARRPAMKRVYRCPHCRAILNPGTKVVLRAQLGKEYGIFLFSPQPGNYDVIIPEGFSLKKGDSITFFCPACTADLTSSRDRALAEINVTTGSHLATVAFSKTYGQHATYFITHEEVKSYGEHALAAGVNFWGEGPEQRHR
jgi:hypothetical protein